VMTTWAEEDGGIRENRTLETDPSLASVQALRGSHRDSLRSSLRDSGQAGKRVRHRPLTADPSPAPNERNTGVSLGDPAFATLLVMTAWAEEDAGIRENRTLETDRRCAESARTTPKEDAASYAIAIDRYFEYEMPLC
jgi:hypothetical protein